MTDCAVVSSISADRRKTQAGLVYLLTALERFGFSPTFIDLSGRVDYYNAPKELYMPVGSSEWLNATAVAGSLWMDEYLPEAADLPEVVFFTALFSPDIPFQARLAARVMENGGTTIIGGNALPGLQDSQIRVVCELFDHVVVGHGVDEALRNLFDSRRNIANDAPKLLRATQAPSFRPDYSLVELSDFVTVYSGHGCYYGSCRFCDYPSRAQSGTLFREPGDVATDVATIAELRPSVEDIVLTQDSYTRQRLLDTATAIQAKGSGAPYNLMFRAEQWVDEPIGNALAESGCTDVFIGAEAFDDRILGVLNKGIRVRDIEVAVRALAPYVRVTLGMILFVPGIEAAALDDQLRQLEPLLRYVDSIEPEVLTVVNGSEFSRRPRSFGIALNAVDRVLNDSWCYGLSQDIPWAMEDLALREAWFNHTDRLRSLCNDWVEQPYWDAVESLRAT